MTLPTEKLAEKDIFNDGDGAKVMATISKFRHQAMNVLSDPSFFPKNSRGRVARTPREDDLKGGGATFRSDFRKRL